MGSFFPSGTRMGALRMDYVIEWYDGPILFVARDDLEHAYLGYAVDREAGREAFLYVPISEDRLLGVRTGLVPLREAFTQPEGKVLFRVTVPMNGETSTSEIDITQLFEEELPDADEYLSERIPSVRVFSAEGLARQATQQNRHLTALEFEQDDLFHRTEFPVRKLNEILTEYQELADVLSFEGKTRTEQAALDVEYSIVELAAASFVVVLAPYIGNRLLEAPSVASDEVADLVAAAADDDAFEQAVGLLSRRGKAHVRDFFASLSGSRTGLTIVDAKPNKPPRRVNVSLERVEGGLNILRATKDLEPETFDVVGYLISINHERGRFGIREERATGGRKHARRMSGRIASTIRNDLVATGRSVVYRFVIQEEQSVPTHQDGIKPRARRTLIDFQILSG